MRLIYPLLLFIFFYSANSQSDKRSELTSLNGIWEIIYDEKNEGKINGFHTNDGFTKGKIEKIHVPSVWERYKKDYEGVVYYRTKFKVDKSKKNNKIHLNFKASNYITEIFLNDNSVGFHEGGFTPFSFNIEHIVDFEKDNILIVKVLGPITIQEKIIDGIGQMETPQWRGSYTGGIWQDVFLSYTGQTHFNDVFVKANYKNGEIEIENEIINGLGDGMYKIVVYINNNFQDEKTFELKNSNLRIKEVINTKINSHKLWSPDNPNVYDLNLKLFKLSLSLIHI